MRLSRACYSNISNQAKRNDTDFQVVLSSMSNKVFCLFQVLEKKTTLWYQRDESQLIKSWRKICSCLKMEMIPTNSSKLRESHSNPATLAEEACSPQPSAACRRFHVPLKYSVNSWRVQTPLWLTLLSIYINSFRLVRRRVSLQTPSFTSTSAAWQLKVLLHISIERAYLTFSFATSSQAALTKSSFRINVKINHQTQVRNKYGDIHDSFAPRDSDEYCDDKHEPNAARKTGWRRGDGLESIRVKYVYISIKSSLCLGKPSWINYLHQGDHLIIF